MEIRLHPECSPGELLCKLLDGNKSRKEYAKMFLKLTDEDFSKFTVGEIQVDDNLAFKLYNLTGINEVVWVNAERAFRSGVEQVA